MPAFSEDAQNAVDAIAKSCRALQTNLARTHPYNFGSLVLEFKTETRSSLWAIENYGTDVHFADAIEWFVAAANSWNKHVYACLRSGNGEIQHAYYNVRLVLYGGEFAQELDEFQDTMSASESSPLRSLQSMQYKLEYYQTLVKELQTTFSFLPWSGFDLRGQIYAKRVEDLQYRIRQLEFGFETAGATWEEQRSLSSVALQWRQEEERITFEREEMKRIQAVREQQRIEAEAREEAAKLAREEEHQKNLRKKRISAMEQERELATLREAQRQNATLRMKIRLESRQVGSQIQTPSSVAVEPWAIFYEDDPIDNFLSGLMENYQNAPRATTPNHLSPSDPFSHHLPRPKSAQS